jgi:PTH2 family peptidyl-tRNA hydrolase
MRTDTVPKMRKGKMIAQGAHASLAATLENLEDPRVKEWLAGQFTKVCVRATRDDLDQVYVRAVKAGVIARIIEDAGKTEFGGQPTVTCMAVGPDTDEVLAPITGHLELL